MFQTVLVKLERKRGVRETKTIRGGAPFFQACRGVRGRLTTGEEWGNSGDRGKKEKKVWGDNGVIRVG